MRTPEDVFEDIAQACSELTWVIAINEAENGDISGIVVGTLDYVEGVLAELEDEADYSICAYGGPSREDLH